MPPAIYEHYAVSLQSAVLLLVLGMTEQIPLIQPFCKLLAIYSVLLSRQNKALGIHKFSSTDFEKVVCDILYSLTWYEGYLSFQRHEIYEFFLA